MNFLAHGIDPSNAAPIHPLPCACGSAMVLGEQIAKGNLPKP